MEEKFLRELVVFTSAKLKSDQMPSMRGASGSIAR